MALALTFWWSGGYPPPPPPPSSPIRSTSPCEAALSPAPPHSPRSDSLTQMPNGLNESVEAQWSFLFEKWGSGRERLASAGDEGESRRDRSRYCGCQFNMGLASLALMQQRQQGIALGLGNGESCKSLSKQRAWWARYTPYPCSLSADSNWEEEELGAECESSTTHTHPSLG